MSYLHGFSIEVLWKSALLGLSFDKLRMVGCTYVNGIKESNSLHMSLSKGFSAWE